MADIARKMGEPVFPDAKYVAKLETGDIRYPRPVYRHILAELCHRPFSELGFSPPPGLSLPGGGDSGGSNSGKSGGIAPTKRMNIALRNAIMASGLELPQIARRMGVDPKSVQRWITRGVTPHPRHRWEICDILECDESELWPDADEKSGPEIESEAPWHLAQINLNGSFTPDDEERLILAARSPRRYDPGIIDALSTVLAGQRRAEDAIGSASLIESVTAQLAMVSDIVTKARGDLRAKVLDIGGQWAQFAGWLHANTGKLGEANRLYNLALEWASETDEPNMIATALNMQGHTAWLGAKAGPMIGLSRAAQRDKRASPGVRALAIQQEARGVALSGDAKVADIDRKFDHAEILVAEAAQEPESEPPWIYFFSPDYLILQRGLAYRLLGEYDKANELLTAGLSAIPADMRKSEWIASHYLLNLAVNHAKSGNVSAASDLACEINAIAQQTHADSLRAALIRFHAQLSRKWPDDPHVIQLGEALH